MKLRIDGNDLDLEGQVVAITRQAYNFLNLGVNLIDRSNEFSLHKTQENKRVLENPDILNNDGLQFEKKFNGQLIDAGVTLLSGSGFITESGENYSLQLVDGAREFFDLLESSMRSLNLDSEDFVYTSISTVFDNFRSLNSSIWLWAITLQRTDDSSWENTPLDGVYQYIRPGFAVIKLIEKIESYTGWAFDYNGASAIWNLYNSLFITSNHKDFISTSYEKIISASYTGDSAVSLSTYNFKETSVTATAYIDVHSQKCKVRLRGDVSATEDFYVIIRSVTVADQSKNKTERFFFSAETTEINILTNKFDQGLANNRIYLNIETSGTVTFTDCYFYTVISEEDLSFALSGFKVKTYENIDNESILSFLKEIMNITGSFFTGDFTRKVINMYNYLSFNKLNVEDWSSKFIKEGFKISTDDSLAKKNYFVYSNDDTVDTNEGSSFFENENENAKGEDNVLEIGFSASKDSVFNTGDWYYFSGSQIFEQTTAYLPIYSSNIERFELSKRILSFYTLNLREGFPFPTDYQDFTFAYFEPLDFSTLVNSVYKEIALSLRKPRILKAYFNLKKKDVSLFNFTNQIYIDYFKSNFFIQEISDFIANDKTLVTLIRKSDG